MKLEQLKFDELQTPCFILDENDFKKNINNFKRVLNKYFETSIIGYSFKTNSLPRVLQLAKECGCFAEVVSADEYLLAETIGFDPENIIFNGPVKEKQVFLKALEGGSFINIDAKREIEWLIEYGKPVSIGIRVNLDTESYVPGHTHTGRFGFCYENGELHDAIEKLRINGYNVSRLHMHVSSTTRSPEVFECLSHKACEIIEKEALEIEAIDFGGGYFGGGDDGEHYETYISKIYETLKIYGMEKLKIIVEPGASVVASAFSYMTTVVDTKKTTYGDFVTVDGTRLHIDPLMTKSRYQYNTLQQKEGENAVQTVCGYTCMEKDRIMEYSGTRLEIGDRIEFEKVGSYTMCFNSLFITYLPTVYSKIDSEYVIVREKWNVEEYIQKSRWEF